MGAATVNMEVDGSETLATEQTTAADVEIDFAADDGDEIISEPTLLHLSLAQLSAANKTEHKEAQLAEKSANKKNNKKKKGDSFGGVQSHKGISKKTENRKRPGKGKGAAGRNRKSQQSTQVEYRGGNRGEGRKSKKGGRGGKGNAAPGRKGLAPLKRGVIPKTPIQRRLGMTLEDLAKLKS